MQELRRKLVFAGALAPALAGLAGRSHAQASGYYRDKVININVAGGPSGGHTRYARMIQPFLQKHTGAREVRITNMPGGGGLKAANYIWRIKPDGLQLFFGNVSTLVLAHLAGSPGATFDPNKLVFLGRATSEPRVLCVGGKSTIKSIQDVQKLKRPFVYPSQGTDEDFYTMAVLADALGFKIKAVTGYEGNADTSLAVIKGDGDGHITGWSESLGPIRSGDKHPILMVTSQKSPDYPSIPVVTEIAPAPKKATVRAMANILETHRSYIGPPGMDPQAVSAFRAAVTAALKDPELLEESKKGERPVAPMEGAQQQKVIEEITKSSASLAPILKAAVKGIQ
ncbi:MAG TPA: tripartite tricarboxylate transporter substrate-binding protein [Burkholderiales bacterium]|nr:tripartite tricarboxylate transporter substrate-binding protein [Burkholderiales bacterium]